MRKILETITVAMLSLLASVPLVAPVTDTATASVTVACTCDVQATDVLFGTWTPGTTTSTLDSTVSQVNGNMAASLEIKGLDWTGGTGMAVGQTHWNTNPLTTTFASVGTLDPITSTPVSLYVVIPAHQTAASYSQIITFQVSCDLECM